MFYHTADEEKFLQACQEFLEKQDHPNNPVCKIILTRECFRRTFGESLVGGPFSVDIQFARRPTEEY